MLMGGRAAEQLACLESLLVSSRSSCCWEQGQPGGVGGGCCLWSGVEGAACGVVEIAASAPAPAFCSDALWPNGPLVLKLLAPVAPQQTVHFQSRLSQG